MDVKPLTAEEEAIARRNDKKIDMTLDDIIKMSKSNASKGKKHRVSNKSQFFNGGVAGAAAKGNSGKMRRFMDSRSSVRQGYLAKRRSNFHDNQFPLAAEAARKAMTAPIRNRPFYNRNRGGVNWSRPRNGGVLVQRSEGSFVVKKQLQMKAPIKPKAQTLDSLFANMKEQRMKAQQNNGQRGFGGGRQQQGRPRFANFGRWGN